MLYNLIATNVLGLEWDPRLDQLQIVPSEKLMNEASWRFSKCNALALISSLFDPLGLLSSLSIRGRIFMQSLWKLKINWDEPLLEEYSKALTPKRRMGFINPLMFTAGWGL